MAKAGTKKRRIAVVVHRYGEEVSGGAELHARWLAEHLTAIAEVHAITTCAVDYRTWANEYPAGESHLNGVHVHRFPVDVRRHWRKFQRLTGQIVKDEPSILEQLKWMQLQGPLSTGFLKYLSKVYDDFDVFIFFTYLYATTYFGLPLVADKTILVPTAHDEYYLYLPIYRPLFHLAHTIAYNTTTEKELVNRITRNGERQQDRVVGIGINVPPEASAERFRQKFGIEGDFLLYVGRIAESKNVRELFHYFFHYIWATDRSIPLVLIGKASINIPDHPQIIHLGFLPEQDKFDALQAASLVVVPSRFESLSMLTLEAWLTEKPVLVNGLCDVLRDLTQESNAGLYYRSFDEFEAALNILLDQPDLRAQLGRSGRHFTLSRYDWPIVIEKYCQILRSF